MSTSAFATNAYRLMQGLQAKPDVRGADTVADAIAAPGSAEAQPDFASMVRDAVQGVIDQGKTSEAKSAAYANGKGNVIDVVTAVSETEVAMETMVAMRDKVISAYEDIMKMAM